MIFFGAVKEKSFVPNFFLRQPTFTAFLIPSGQKGLRSETNNVVFSNKQGEYVLRNTIKNETSSNRHLFTSSCFFQDLFI